MKASSTVCFWPLAAAHLVIDSAAGADPKQTFVRYGILMIRIAYFAAMRSLTGCAEHHF
jgi:hypothetical protein